MAHYKIQNTKAGKVEAVCEETGEVFIATNTKGFSRSEWDTERGCKRALTTAGHTYPRPEVVPTEHKSETEVLMAHEACSDAVKAKDYAEADRIAKERGFANYYALNRVAKGINWGNKSEAEKEAIKAKREEYKARNAERAVRRSEREEKMSMEAQEKRSEGKTAYDPQPANAFIRSFTGMHKDNLRAVRRKAAKGNQVAIKILPTAEEVGWGRMTLEDALAKHGKGKGKSESPKVEAKAAPTAKATESKADKLAALQVEMAEMARKIAELAAS